MFNVEKSHMFIYLIHTFVLLSSFVIIRFRIYYYTWVINRFRSLETYYERRSHSGCKIRVHRIFRVGPNNGVGRWWHIWS